MTRWRWDQGRLDYFSVESLRKIASVFIELDGLEDGDRTTDVLREPLVDATGLPFSPDSYKVWRNYARVIKLGMIASRVNGFYRCTEIAKSLVSGEMAADSDSYLVTIAKRTFYPSPAFEGYTPLVERTYPMLAIIKLLLTERFSVGGISSKEVCSFLAGNNVSGLESFEFYSSLTETSRRPLGDELRQINEMMKVMSQISFLFWDHGRLLFDSGFSSVEKAKFYELLIPDAVCHELPEESDLAILALGKLTNETYSSSDFVDSLDFEDSSEDEVIPHSAEGEEIYQEGRRKLVNHLRIERNSKLREHFLSSTPEPDKCDMCLRSSRTQYPWVVSLIEVHHKLPLSSAVRVQGNSTSLEDLVGLCPSCHKAVHQYYRHFLREKGTSDFSTREEAFEVYELVRNLYTSTDI